MEIKPYKGKRSEVIKLLYENGVLAGYPKQIKRDDLQYAEGVDIVIPFSGMTPAKFKEYADAILWAAYEEAKRYEGEPIIFAKFIVKLYRNEKGRKVLSQPTREYVAKSNADPEVLVFGKQALGYTPTRFIGGKEVEETTFLINKVDEILNITEKYLKEYLSKQVPYKVMALVVCVRRKRPFVAGT